MNDKMKISDLFTIFFKKTFKNTIKSSMGITSNLSNVTGESFVHSHFLPNHNN